MNLLDIHDEAVRLARAGRDDGVKRSDDHSNDAWRATMWQHLNEWAESHPFFTTDDLLISYERLPNAPRTHNNKAMGAQMVRAVKEGVCRDTGERPKSVRRHMTEIKLYKSLIYRDEDAA